MMNITHGTKTTLFFSHSNHQQTWICSISTLWTCTQRPIFYLVCCFLWRRSPHSRRGWRPADTFGKTSRATRLLSAEKEDNHGHRHKQPPRLREKLPALGGRKVGMTYSSSSACLPFVAATEEGHSWEQEGKPCSHGNSFCSLSNLVHANCFWI